KIVKINPSNGKVAAEIDFTNLLPQQLSEDVDVLNGIAWNPTNDHFYVTGKLWPRLYEVRLYFQK
ncbi:MAG: glutaminyl-peptide cyclotransferase, partial [Bacteroidales bacterium]|nr:glutaminyl-peptide cyclotransferase [Bacteroidales bacterium]